MALITSISGIRGTIGGQAGNGLTPVDTVKFASAYALWLKDRCRKNEMKVVIGRDARISGPMVDQLVSGTLIGMGIDVINAGLASTPTVELAVQSLNADGGIILTASHNPRQWNALKLLNEHGEFLSAADGEQILRLVKQGNFTYAEVDYLGSISQVSDMNDYHVRKVLELPLVDTGKISQAGFRVVIDCINSVGGIILPVLLKELGVKEIIEINCFPDGDFKHNPEPLPENLGELSRCVTGEKADLGLVVDPDVDRLAIVCEDGTMFGEEYTLVAVADYVLSKTPGKTCSNLSSSRALRMITEKHGQQYFAAAVGEVNVVEKMKEMNCIIGGEGNGGIIYPELHYGRDALVGVALFLTHLADKKMKASELRDLYPRLEMVKSKQTLSEKTDIESILETIEKIYASEKTDRTDGLKIDFPDGWVHLRKSNTEPIIRIYAEASEKQEAEKLVSNVIKEIERLEH